VETSLSLWQAGSTVSNRTGGVCPSARWTTATIAAVRDSVRRCFTLSPFDLTTGESWLRCSRSMLISLLRLGRSASWLHRLRQWLDLTVRRTLLAALLIAVASLLFGIPSELRVSLPRSRGNP